MLTASNAPAGAPDRACARHLSEQIGREALRHPRQVLHLDAPPRPAAGSPRPTELELAAQRVRRSGRAIVAHPLQLAGRGPGHPQPDLQHLLGHSRVGRGVTPSSASSMVARCVSARSKPSRRQPRQQPRRLRPRRRHAPRRSAPRSAPRPAFSAASATTSQRADPVRSRCPVRRRVFMRGVERRQLSLLGLQLGDDRRQRRLGFDVLGAVVSPARGSLPSSTAASPASAAATSSASAGAPPCLSVQPAPAPPPPLPACPGSP